MSDERLPKLIGRRELMDELGVKSGVADAIIRQLPATRIGRRVFVRRDQVAQLIRDHTFAPDQTIRPPPRLPVWLQQRRLDTPVPADPLPRLLDQHRLRDRLGVSGSAASMLFGRFPLVLLNDTRRVFVRGDLVDGILAEFSYDPTEPRRNRGRHARWRRELAAALGRGSPE